MKPLVINLVVACTNRKTAPPVLRMRDYRALPFQARLQRWVAALADGIAEGTTPARNLYAGDHWTIARTLAEDPPEGTSIRLWVSSAGYGLVALDDELIPYSATFSARLEDSVIGDDESLGTPRQQNVLWWQGLTAMRAQPPGKPRTVTEIATTEPNAPLMISASPRYIEAMLPDITSARLQLTTPDLLSIFSSREARLLELAGHAVPYDGRLQRPQETSGQSAIGGAYPSLNIRAAALAIGTVRQTGCGLAALKRHFEQLGSRMPPPRTFNRRRSEPVEVAAFIRAALGKNPRASHTQLLREFRDSGRAFEYTRFRAVFQEVSKAQST